MDVGVDAEHLSEMFGNDVKRIGEIVAVAKFLFERTTAQGRSGARFSDIDATRRQAHYTVARVAIDGLDAHRCQKIAGAPKPENTESASVRVVGVIEGLQRDALMRSALALQSVTAHLAETIFVKYREEKLSRQETAAHLGHVVSAAKAALETLASVMALDRATRE